MLDGFQFDTEYNSGPFDKARLPESKGITALPSGMIPVGNPIFSGIPDGVEADYDMDLSDFTKSATQDISVVDHSWLASQPKPNLEGMRTHEDILEQFAEGRFENPEVNQLKALEGAWGQSTTGLDIIPNSQRKHDKYKNSYGDNQTKLPGDDYREVQEKAMRKLAYGKEAIDEIISEVEGLLSEAEEKAQKVASALKREYGLNGRVYIRERDFPGLFNGRWDEVINKRCASSLYIISNKEDCAFDRFLGREVIASESEIDWKRTASILMPKLRSFGVRKGSGSHKEIIKRAFIDLMEGHIENIERPSTWWQVQADPSAGVSLSDAMSALENAEIEETRIASQEEVGEAKLTKKLARIAEQLVAEGFVEEEQVEAVCGCGKTAREKIARLYAIASQPTEVGSYEGMGREVHAHEGFKSRLDPNAYVPVKGEREAQKHIASIQTKVASLIQHGLISIDEVERVTKKGKTASEKLSRVYAYLAEPAKVASYTGQYENTKVMGVSPKWSDGDIEALQRHASNTEKKNLEVRDTEKKNLEVRNERALTRIAKMINLGLISHTEVETAIKGRKTPEQKLASVFEYLAKPKQVGSYQDYAVTEHRMTPVRNKPLAVVPDKVKRASEQVWVSARNKVQRLVDSGLLSKQAYEDLSEIKDPDLFVKRAFSIAATPTEAGEYQGAETQHILGQKKSSERLASENKVATWLKQKMSEGSAGKELDVLLRGRFSEAVLSEHKARIASLRSEHEGVSGHAYVDASAYMTEGVEGCEKGALIHRANQIPVVLGMKKCGSCVFNVDGTCQKYNKGVVASLEGVVEDLRGYQKEMIRLANSSDSERTASLFVNNYDADEFGLVQEGGVDIDDAPSSEELGDVFFGGFEV
jgi:hypothetical protein